MDDVEYLLRQDAKEKKAAGRGIYHKHSGSKTKYVSLPSDRLTEAEKKRRNGPIMSYNLSGRMSYKEFKALPVDLAGDYIRTLQSTYRANLSNMALMMGVKPTTLSEHLRSHHIPHSAKPGGFLVDPSWEEFMKGRLNSKGESIKQSPAEEEPDPTQVSEGSAAPAAATPKAETLSTAKSVAAKFYIESTGTPENLLGLLMTAFADMAKADSHYHLTLSLQEVDSP